MGDHSAPPLAPGSIRVPSGVGRAKMFSCGTKLVLLRTSLPVAASSTYTQPVLPAWTTTFLPPSLVTTGGETASRSQTSCGTVW